MTDIGGEHGVTEEEAARRFWERGDREQGGQVGGGGSLTDVPVGNVPALGRLGASPFPKGGFPVLGFLETVYEQVTSHGAGQLGGKQE